MCVVATTTILDRRTTIETLHLRRARLLTDVRNDPRHHLSWKLGVDRLPPRTKTERPAGGASRSSHRSAQLPGGDHPRVHSGRARMALRSSIGGLRTPAGDRVHMAPYPLCPPLRGRPAPR
jgi:hypothetical protein